MAFSELDKKLIEQIKIFRAEGWTTAAIAKELKVSTSKIERLVAAANLPSVLPQKISAERLALLNTAAKKYNYASWEVVPVGPDRDRVAGEATRRAAGKAVGKGRPGVPRTAAEKAAIAHEHWTKTKPKAEVSKIMSGEGYKAYRLRQLADQINILKAVQSGKYTTADQIRKAVGLSKEVFDKKVDRLFGNVYTQIGNMNTKKVRAYVTEEFLPKDLNKLEKIRDQLGKIKGFQSTEQRSILKQIEEAYGQKGVTPNRKAFDVSRKKVADFRKVKDAINRKYPTINLELDHPLNYKTIKGLGKTGEKFLYVTPLDSNINRGFKEVLGNRYATAVKAGDRQLMLQIENLAKDLGTTVGKVRGTRVAEYGTTLLRESDLGGEIISSLRQQNVIADKIAEMTKSGELKTRMTEIGVKTPRAYNIGKVSSEAIEGIKKIIKQLSEKKQIELCSVLSRGGLPGNCAAAIDANPVKTAEIFSKAEATTGTMAKLKNASRGFLSLLGRGGAKVAPYAALAAAGAAAEPLVKQFVIDDPNTYLTNENQQKGMLLSLLEREPPKVDDEILKWQNPALAGATAAGAIPGAGTVYKARRSGVPLDKSIGPLKEVGKTRSALGISGVLGKALGASFSPLAVAATLPISVAAEREGGTEWGDIATDPSHWMGPAFAASGAEMASKGIKNPLLLKALRLGMSPRALMLGSRFLGLPGLALTAGMWGYDKWKKSKDDDEFKVRRYRDDDED